MSRSVIEYFKINQRCLIPVEYRFIRCRIINGGQEYMTYEWMNNELWKELIEATKLLLGTCDTIKNYSSFEPCLSTTTNLKLAFLVKDNAFKRPIYMEPSNQRTGLFETLVSFESQLVVSVSLNKPDVKLQDLQTALSQNQGEAQLKISSYFMQTVSLCEKSDNM